MFISGCFAPVNRLAGTIISEMTLGSVKGELVNSTHLDCSNYVVFNTFAATDELSQQLIDEYVLSTCNSVIHRDHSRHSAHSLTHSPLDKTTAVQRLLLHRDRKKTAPLNMSK